VPTYRLSAVAEQQVREALAWSEGRFGLSARSRYATLLVTAMGDVAEDPGRPNVATVRAGGRSLSLYHIGHSRRRVPNRHGRVSEPRHLLVFEVGADGIVDILGLIHERMLRGRALRRLVRGFGGS
jgi:toxin ParE1/3/4